MKNMKNIIKSLIAIAVTGAGLTGCSLEMLPLNEVVLENYWTNKSDVESVVTSCYVAMQENDYVSKLIVWGEDRSDNISEGPDVPTDLKNLMKGNLKTTNGYNNWSAMYNVINRCNTVLYYAPQVAENDPNYTESDLAVNIAECKALRAMSYLTLIKTFKDVPFSLEPSIDDNIDYRLGQTPFDSVLIRLIDDIEECKNDAPLSYSTKIYNTAKITRAAMYSLLADLYLWRASDYTLDASSQAEFYKKCIECCDFVLNYKISQYVANNIQDEDLTKTVDSEVWTQYGYPLLAENSTSSSYASAASTAIFGEGNSFESIFELTYNYPGETKVNYDVSLMYGGYDSDNALKQYVVGNENLITSEPTSTKYDDNTLFGVTTDYRSINSFFYSSGDSYDIYKYTLRYNSAGQSPYGSVSGSTWTKPTRSQSRRGISTLQYENWIFYRMSEIMLIRAEAEMELAALKSTDASLTTDSVASTGVVLNSNSVALKGSSLSSSKELYDDAFNLISAVYLRSNPACKNTTSAAPARSSYSSIENFRKLLLNERRREFLFEGKRYFDLVRLSRRLGNTSELRTAIVSKYGEASKAVIIKMAQLDFMYMPILKSQIQVNPNLKQNPCYDDEEQSVKN